MYSARLVWIPCQRVHQWVWSHRFAELTSRVTFSRKDCTVCTNCEALAREKCLAHATAIIKRFHVTRKKIKNKHLFSFRAESIHRRERQSVMDQYFCVCAWQSVAMKQWLQHYWVKNVFGVSMPQTFEIKEVLVILQHLKKKINLGLLKFVCTEGVIFAPRFP